MVAATLRDRLPSGIWKVVGVATIGSFMAQLDATLVNVSLTSLAKDLHTSLPVIQWVMSGYLLTLALMLPLNGWLVDRVGAKAVYLWCFAAFTVSSGLCGLAWSASSLIGFRILQGMSGGLLAPMAQLMVARAAGTQMPRVASIMTMPILLAPFLGPVAAGAILEFASWRWLFLLNLPVGLLAMLLAALFLPDDRGEARPRTIDLLGLSLLSPGLVLFLYGTDDVSQAIGVGTLAASLLFLVLFWRVARRKGDAALVDLRLLKGRTFSVATTAMFMVNGVTFAGQMLIPIYLIRSCGVSPSRAGWLLMPLGLGMLCTYPFLGRLTDRFGIRKLASGGAVLSLAGTASLVFLAHHGLAVSLLAAGLFVRGAGLSAIGVPATSSGYVSMRREDLPTAAGIMNIGQRLGGPTLMTLCASVLGWQLAGTNGPAATSAAFVTAFSLLCVLHGVLFLVTLTLPWTLPGATKDARPVSKRP